MLFAKVPNNMGLKAFSALIDMQINGSQPITAETALIK